MKKCKICRKEKEITEFYSQNRTRKDGSRYIYYHPECKECAKSKTTAWRRANRDRVNELNKIYNNKESYREKRRESARERVRNGKYQKWQSNNKDKLKKYGQQHRNHEISKNEWESCKEYFNHSCAYCGLHIDNHFRKYKGKPKNIDLHKEHVDHQGANDLSNCVPACQSCNGSKNIFSLQKWYTPDKTFFSEERLNKIYRWLESDHKDFIISINN